MYRASTGCGRRNALRNCADEASTSFKQAYATIDSVDSYLTGMSLPASNTLPHFCASIVAMTAGHCHASVEQVKEKALPVRGGGTGCSDLPKPQPYELRPHKHGSE